MQTIPISDRRVGELVTEDFRRAGVFKRYGIDFCCGGGISLQAACERQGVDLLEISRALSEAEQERGSLASHRYQDWSPEFLADYIVNEHHSFVRENIPVIRAFTQKVAHVHGGTRPELVIVAGLFDEVAREMEAHMASEEQIVFPRIKREGADGDSRTLADLVDDMEEEHEAAGDLMRQIREITGDFQPPDGACNTYRASFAKLEEFEADLHVHVHLENNILFPKAMAREREIGAAADSVSN